MESNIQDKGAEEDEVSTTGFIERVCEEPAVHQHRRYHAGHERNVSGCHSAGHGSRNGRGTGTGTLPAI